MHWKPVQFLFGSDHDTPSCWFRCYAQWNQQSALKVQDSLPSTPLSTCIRSIRIEIDSTDGHIISIVNLRSISLAFLAHLKTLNLSIYEWGRDPSFKLEDGALRIANACNCFHPKGRGKGRRVASDFRYWPVARPHRSRVKICHTTTVPYEIHHKKAIHCL
jgi:hypothetical protein